MVWKINSDLASMFTLDRMRQSQQDWAASLQQVSSGRRLNQAADDAASLQIANLLESQARGLGQQARNAADGVAMTQIADGALRQGGDVLQEVRQKALQAANASQSASSRQALQGEVDRLLGSYNEILATTTFNGQQLLPDTLAVGGEVDLGNPEGATAAAGLMDEALEGLNRVRGDLGSRQNQLNSELASLANATVNTHAAQSQVADADLAQEAMVLSQMQVLRQAQLFALTQGRNLNQANAQELLQGDR